MVVGVHMLLGCTISILHLQHLSRVHHVQQVVKKGKLDHNPLPRVYLMPIPAAPYIRGTFKQIVRDTLIGVLKTRCNISAILLVFLIKRFICVKHSRTVLWGLAKERLPKEALAKEGLAKEGLAKEAQVEEALAKEALTKEANLMLYATRYCFFSLSSFFYLLTD